jgi:hypothetical protein
MERLVGGSTEPSARTSRTALHGDGNIPCLYTEVAYLLTAGQFWSVGGIGVQVQAVTGRETEFLATAHVLHLSLENKDELLTRVTPQLEMCPLSVDRNDDGLHLSHPAFWHENFIPIWKLAVRAQRRAFPSFHKDNVGTSAIRLKKFTQWNGQHARQSGKSGDTDGNSASFNFRKKASAKLGTFYNLLQGEATALSHVPNAHGQ